MEAHVTPETLLDAVTWFADFEHCRQFMMLLRWPDGKVKCPRCSSEHVFYISKERVWKCYAKHSHAKFSLKTGTIFEDSPIKLEKWLPAVWLIGTCKNGISSYELHRGLKVTQKTAWFMNHRIRLAMQDDLTGGMLGGEIEVDETYIGGKARNMHKARRIKADVRGPSKGKTIVLGILERKGRVRATVIPDRTNASIRPVIRGTVEEGTKIFSDEHAGFWRMDEVYSHNIINHLEKYVDGNVHTNGIENFWSLLKRTLGGTYVSVEPFHLFRYVDEQAYRFNSRKLTDAERFTGIMQQIVGRRVTFAELTGKVPETQTPGTN